MKIDPDKLPPPQEPFRGVLPFRLLDWRVFFERDIRTERLGNLVSMYSGVLVYGQSGAGKSSLLNAGFVPEALRRGLAPERVRVFPERGKELLIERIRLREEGVNSPAVAGWPNYLPSRFAEADTDDRVALSCADFLQRLDQRSELGVPLLIFDQFEELVTLFEENPRDEARYRSAGEARKEIDQTLCKLLTDDARAVRIVFVFRDDYLARLTPLFARIPDLLDQRVWLTPPSLDLARQIVRGPFVQVEGDQRGLPGHFKDELSEELADRLVAGMKANRPSGLLDLSELQTICLALWRQPKLREDVMKATDTGAVLRKILESEALAALRKLFWWDRIRAIALLSNLVTKDGTRNVVSEENLVTETRRNPVIWILRWNLKKLLRKLLAGTGLLRSSLSSGNRYYELASEFLIPWIQRKQQQFRRLARVVWAFAFAFAWGLLVVVGNLLQQTEGLLDEQKRTNNELKHEQEATKDALRLKEEQTLKANEATAREKVATLKAENEALKARDAEAKAKEEQARAEEEARRATEALDREKEANAEAEKARAKAVANESAAKEAEEKALAAKKEAYDVINFMQYNLRDMLINAGRVDLLLKVNDRIRRYWEEHPPAPDDWEALREKSVATNFHGDILCNLGRLSAALECFRESLGIAETLARQQPDNAVWLRDLAVSYIKVGGVRRLLGDSGDALKYLREGRAIMEKLAKVKPNSRAALGDLAQIENHVGRVLFEQGNFSEALEHFRAANAIHERLVQARPADSESQQDLANSHGLIGGVLLAQGDWNGTLASSRAGLAIAEKFAQTETENVVWQDIYVGSRNNVGDALLARGDRAGALEHYRAGLALRKAFVERDVLNHSRLHELAASHGLVARTLAEQGKPKPALADLHQAVTLLERLCVMDSANTEWNHSLAECYHHRANLLRDEDDLEDAIKDYRASLLIRDKLAALDPANAIWRLEAARTAADLAVLQLKQKKFSDARGKFELLRELSDRRVAAEPTDYEAQIDRATAWVNLADCEKLLTPHGKQSARAALREAQNILETWKGHGRLQPKHERLLQDVQKSQERL